MSEGNRRKMSEVGVINQRYLIVLKGNAQKLEVNSNQERLRVPACRSSGSPTPGTASRPAWMSPPTARGGPGQGLEAGRAGAGAWTLEVPHQTAHQNGSPGLVRLLAAGHARLHRQHHRHAEPIDPVAP